MTPVRPRVSISSHVAAACAVMLALSAPVALSGCGSPPGLVPASTPVLLKDDPITPIVEVPIIPTSAREMPAAEELASPPTPISATTPAAEESVKAEPAPRLMAIGQRLTIPLRESPSAGSRVVESLPGSEVLWAQAVSPDGRWLEVVYDETGSTAWVLRSDVSLFGDPARLETGANPAQQDVSTPSSLPEGRVIADQLNVRAGPGENHAILGSLHAGERVRIIGRSPDGAWLQIERAGGDAWVAARYVTTAGASNPAIPQPVASRPAPERLKGKIAFQTRTGGDIYLMDADGSNLQRITDGIDPALSPDGTRLAFARWGAPHAILVRDLRTGEERQVVAANRPRGPAWSSDGSRLVFTYSTRSYTCLVSPFGCLEEEELRRRFGGDCLETPFGTICIANLPVQLVDEYGLVAINPDGGGWQDLPAQKRVFTPGWHPAQTELLYRGDRGLQITAPDGMTRPLLDEPQISSPAWSPDGQRIAVQQYLHDHADIFILDAAGKVLQRLTAPPSALEKAPNNVAPAWSPDGSYIVFLSDRDGAWKLYRMRSDGADQRLLAPEALSSLAFVYDFAAEKVASWSP